MGKEAGSTAVASPVEDSNMMQWIDVLLRSAGKCKMRSMRPSADPHRRKIDIT